MMRTVRRSSRTLRVRIDLRAILRKHIPDGHPIYTSGYRLKVSTPWSPNITLSRAKPMPDSILFSVPSADQLIVNCLPPETVSMTM
jgi:hypothetical protein